MISIHYRPKKISEISSKDAKVVLTGNIIQKKENSFILDDETAKIEISSDINTDAKFVRAFCSVAEDKLVAELIQNLDGIDINLFKKVEELYNKVFNV